MDLEIGSAAGDVYRCLESNGSATLSAIKKATGHKESTVAMALGWLAREDKVVRDAKGRSVRWVLADA